MLSLVVTMAILIGAYLLQQAHPVIAGFLAVVPVKIVATSLMTLEDGGVERLHSALGGMLIGQVGWGAVLLAAWLSVK
jgi:hypothetical protein